MKAYKIEAIGRKSDYLFDTITSVFEYVNNVDNAEICLFDTYNGLGEYDPQELNYVLNANIPIIAFESIDYGGMSKETWVGWDNFSVCNDWCSFLKYAKLNGKLLYFMRKMDKTLEYPSWVHPYEVCQYPTHDFTPVSKEELFNRPIDVCFIGNVSPQRVHLSILLKNQFNCYFSLGEERIPNNQWVNWHRQAKLFLTSDGGGFSDERPYQLITISPMLKQKNTHLQLHPFTDNINCLKVSEYPTQEEIQNIKETLADSDKLYNIYINGIKHMKELYSFEARAKYIHQTIINSGICQK